MIGEGLKAHATAGIEAVPGFQQTAESKRDQVFEIAPEGELPPQAMGEAVDHVLMLFDELGSLHGDS
jgi:hypothetical protein